MTRKKTAAVLCALLLTACTSTPSAPAQTSEVTTTTAAVTVASETPAEITTVSEETAASETVTEQTETAADNTPVSLASNEDILSFMQGTWYLSDKYEDRDYLSLEVSADGSVTAKRLTDGVSASGRISFDLDTYSSDGLTPIGYELTLDQVPGAFVGTNDSFFDNTSSGLCQFARKGGEDMAYMSEVGNGGSLVALHVMNDSSDGMETDWVMHRKNGSAPAEPIKDSEFYAFCWKNGDNLVLSPVEHTSSQMENEYTGASFMGGYFTSKGSTLADAAEYDMSYRIDSADLFNTAIFYRIHPLAVYKVWTDSDGQVYAIEETDTAFYGAYRFESVTLPYSYDGTVFRYGETDYDLHEMGYFANAIMDCQTVGDKILIEGHINPHKSEYLIFDTASCDFRPIYGCDLIWKDDDLYTAVYSDYNCILSLSGAVLYNGDSEILEMSFTDDGNIAYTCEDGSEGTIDRSDDPDRALYAYEDYLSMPCASRWMKFMEYAPANSAMFIITSPDTYMSQHLGYEHDPETIAAVSLANGATVRLDSGTLGDDMIWQNSGHGDEYTFDKGMVRMWETPIPEGVPSKYVYMYTPDYSVNWNVCTISGMTGQKSCFVQIEAMG